jgi:sulfur carrier protein
MTVFINNESFNCGDAATLFGVLQLQKLHEQKGIAVAVNNMVITRTSWNSYGLNNGDKITIIKATQGG